MTMSYPFDARPLTDPVDRAAARAYQKALRAQGRLPATSPVVIVLIVVAVVFMTLVVGGMSVGIIGFVGALAGGAGPIAVVFGGFAALIVAGFVIGFVALIVRLVGGGSAERIYRLDRFAQANGMTWAPEATNPPLPGLVFQHGSSRRSTDIVRGVTPRFVEFANYQYKTGSGDSETTHHWGYVAIKLSSPLPHIVLDATSNNALFGSNLPASFDKDQRLSLEGDFDRYFTLYCPAGYERDALYLFTPDIMARFIDNAATLDVEIVDDWVFLYAKRNITTTDPATWAWLFSVVGAFLDKFAQWERWRDDRLAAPTAALAAPALPAPAAEPSVGGAPVAQPAATTALPFAAPDATLRPPPGVAPQGRRLSSKVGWGTIILFIVLALFFVFGPLGMGAAILGSIFENITGGGFGSGFGP